MAHQHNYAIVQQWYFSFKNQSSFSYCFMSYRFFSISSISVLKIFSVSVWVVSFQIIHISVSVNEYITVVQCHSRWFTLENTG